MFFIEYKLDKAGWAYGKIGNVEKEIKFVVSYLHDSLLELAQSAIDIQVMTSKQVIFMDEPGEFILKLKREGNMKLSYELRWYDDWFSWGMYPEDNFKLMLSGETTVSRYVNQVRNLMLQLMEKHTEKEYKKLWVEHDFPSKAFNKLK